MISRRRLEGEHQTLFYPRIAKSFLTGEMVKSDFEAGSYLRDLT